MIKTYIGHSVLGRALPSGLNGRGFWTGYSLFLAKGLVLGRGIAVGLQRSWPLDGLLFISG